MIQRHNNNTTKCTHSIAACTCEAKLACINRALFEEILLLRLAPYSHTSNPIENYWSALKAKVKDIMRERREEINNGTVRQDGESLASKRLRILEAAAQ